MRAPVRGRENSALDTLRRVRVFEMPWLQFWLQFMPVRTGSGEYERPGQDPHGPARTPDRQAHNPSVVGSSPTRPTHSYS
jgi:hypothetical protein